jgi:hypothetical protein
MREKKQDRAALRRTILQKSIEWNFPPSDWEAKLCAEIEKRPIVWVPRAPPEQLAWARMKVNACHTNVRWYAENDPEKKSRVVTGWWVQDPNYVLHSVVERDGQLICITPSHSGETKIPFIPDSEIEWTVRAKVYCAFRNGREIGPGIRKFPALTMALISIICKRLRSGGNPYKASEFGDEEFEELKRQYGAV